MIAPRVQIYVQPTPYTVGEMMPGSHVTILNRHGRQLTEYRAGDPVTVDIDAWPAIIRVLLPGFNMFTCFLERYRTARGIYAGGYDGTDGLPGRIPGGA